MRGLDGDRLDSFAVDQNGSGGAVRIERGGQAAKAAYWPQRANPQVVPAISELADLRLRPDALAFYMATMAQGPVEQRVVSETLFENVRKAPAGLNTIVETSGEAKLFPRAPAPLEPGLSEETMARRLKEALLDTARDVLAGRSTVWLEASGGIDSTLMGALARRVLPAGSRMNTLSILYPYYEFRRERRFIDIAVAALSGTPTFLDGARCLSFSDLDAGGALSEPSLVMAGLAQHRAMFAAVNEPDALLLTGNGGDNLFALGPDRQPRFTSKLAQHDWMSNAFATALAAHFERLRDHYAKHAWANDEAFQSGSDLDDRWTEREITSRLGIHRTHLFLTPDILSLISGLWRQRPTPAQGKWILVRYFEDLIPSEILHRTGKVAYNGLYVRAYRAASRNLVAMVNRHRDHLDSMGVSANGLALHIDRLRDGKLEGDLEVSTVVTYLMWLEGWARSGRPLI